MAMVAALDNSKAASVTIITRMSIIVLYVSFSLCLLTNVPS
jgi:hypothetical protein